jgi:F-type H+-transporting ATPase subunit alpha
LHNTENWQCFAQFGSDLDKATKDKLIQGERLMETLKQPQYATMPVEDQVIVLFAATNKYLMDIEVKEVRKFNTELVRFMEDRYPQIGKSISETGELKPDMEELLKKGIEEFKAGFKR